MGCWFHSAFQVAVLQGQKQASSPKFAGAREGAVTPLLLGYRSACSRTARPAVVGYAPVWRDQIPHQISDATFLQGDLRVQTARRAGLGDAAGDFSY